MNSDSQRQKGTRGSREPATPLLSPGDLGTGRSWPAGDPAAACRRRAGGTQTPDAQPMPSARKVVMASVGIARTAGSPQSRPHREDGVEQRPAGMGAAGCFGRGGVARRAVAARRGRARAARRPGVAARPGDSAGAARPGGGSAAARQWPRGAGGQGQRGGRATRRSRAVAGAGGAGLGTGRRRALGGVYLAFLLCRASSDLRLGKG